VTAYRAIIALCAALALAACQSTSPSSLPRGEAAYQILPPVPATTAAPVARPLRAGDTIAIEVYREPDLSTNKAIVDDVGNVQLPLLGVVTAAGHTPAEFSDLLQSRLAARYLRNPRVTVALLESAARTLTVEGQVNNPGIFPVRQNETLLSALAQAKSPTSTARLNEVVVFRTVNGQRLGGVFNLDQIRTGRAPDPQIIDGDIVVVGFSQLKGAFRSFLATAPLLNLFTVF
jgi:polysaccharide export outer membrane protein